MNIWLHRISHEAEVSYPLLEKGYLSIGFSDFAYSEFSAKTRGENGGDYFDTTIINAWGYRPRTRHNLWRFIVGMKKGDWVLVPISGAFSLYVIEEDAKPISELVIEDLKTWNNKQVHLVEGKLHAEDRFFDLGFTCKVKPIETNISRYSYADAALTSRMKYRATNTDISDLGQNIDVALEAFRKKKPINLHSQILDAGQSGVLKLIQEKVTPDKFESLIGWYFEQMGASNVFSPAKNEPGKEGDADIIATFEPLKTIYYIQAKHHKNITSDWAAQQIRDYKNQKDENDDGYSRIAWVVSSGDSFSDECKNMAKEESIVLISGPDLARMILEAGIENLDKAF